MEKTILPNFLIVGAAKSGTTSLYYYLKQHPQIFMPDEIKETFFLVEPKSMLGKGPGYFGQEMVNTFSAYKKLFEISGAAERIGEACVGYLYFYMHTIPNILKYLGQPKIIIILRNPVERAYSNYYHHVRDDLEDLTFEEAILAQAKRKKENWWWGFQLISPGFYWSQVNAYVENFNNVKIFLYDDLKRNAESLVNDIFDYLEVNHATIPNLSVKYNPSGITRSKIIRKYILEPNEFKNKVKPLMNFIDAKTRKDIYNFILKKNLRKAPPMLNKTKKYLINTYYEDILKLQELINRDLTSWLK